MKSTWLNSGDDAQLAGIQRAYWSNLGKSVQNGTFWADEIKAHRDSPARRLAMALDNLPLPAAFSEACIGLRAMIRDCKVETEKGKELLGLLYWLAAVESFMLDRAPILGEPGFNVMESIPGSVIRGLEFSFAELGYECLRVLNKTDKKWLIAAFGTPRTHRTLNDIHSATWNRYEMALVEIRRQENENIFGKPRVMKQKPTRLWWKFWK